ncbi:MAG: hypothetical protein RL701_8043 [Pseudomonadota bacterium]|jgi:hypothetical protein
MQSASQPLCSSAIQEDKQVASQRVYGELVLYQRTQAIEALTKVRRRCGQIQRNTRRKRQHCSTAISTLRSICATYVAIHAHHTTIARDDLDATALRWGARQSNL